MAELFNVGTLGEMNARVTRWARERVDTDMVNDAINDAIQSLWKSVSLATLSRFISPAVSITLPSGATSVPVVSIPDPETLVDVFTVAGGALPARQAFFSYTILTDSGSQTMGAPANVYNAAVNTLYSVRPPMPVQGAIGWSLYAGGEGRLVLQNVAPLSFFQTWLEPLAGMLQTPTGPFPPVENTTGDNITSIARLDVANLSGTLTPQDQVDIRSSLFTLAQNRLSSTSTYVRHAYDLVDNSRIEIRPSPLADLDATAFYIVRPRRLRYPQSLLPFSSFDGQQFISQQALSDLLHGLYEFDAAKGWQEKANAERLRIQLAVLQENWGKNRRVRRFM